MSVVLFFNRNLDSATKSVYKENIVLTKSVGYHKDEAEQLKKQKEKLENKTKELEAEKELNQKLIEQKIADDRQNKQLIKQVNLSNFKYFEF